MKGIVFKSFLDFLETSYGNIFVEDCLTNVPLESGGVYSGLGYYEFSELEALLTYTCEKHDEYSDKVLQNFGRFLFSQLFNSHPEIVNEYTNSIEFLTFIENHIHFEVTKLYPDASPPDIKVTFEDNGDAIKLNYKSTRPLAYLFLGLVEGCLEHMGEDQFFKIHTFPDPSNKVMSLVLTVDD